MVFENCFNKNSKEGHYFKKKQCVKVQNHRILALCHETHSPYVVMKFHACYDRTADVIIAAG